MPEYILERKSRQKYIRMHFKDNGTLIVSCPMRTSQKELDSFVLSHIDWIEKYKNAIPEHSYQNGDLIPYLGKKFTLITIKGKYSANVIDNAIIVSVPHPENLLTVRKQLYKLYEQTLLKYAEANAQYWSNQLNVAVPEIQVCNAKTRWGCCYSYQELVKLSAITASLPEDLIQLILVHELCHLRYHNHQQNFYNLLRSAIPDLDEKEARLKQIDKAGLHKNLF